MSCSPLIRASRAVSSGLGSSLGRWCRPSSRRKPWASDRSVISVTESGLITIITGLPCESLARTRKDEGMMVISVNPAFVRSSRNFWLSVRWGLGVRRRVLIASRTRRRRIRRRRHCRTGKPETQKKRARGLAESIHRIVPPRAPPSVRETANDSPRSTLRRELFFTNCAADLLRTSTPFVNGRLKQVERDLD